MLSILAIVTPVFGLIAIGYLAGYLRILRPETGAGVSDFAFTIGLPAVLFRTIATAELSAVSPTAVLASFFGAAWTAWIVSTMLTHAVLRRPAIDAPAIAMSSVFGNTIMLGLPLSLQSFGAEAAAPMALILAVHAPLLWMTGTVHAELLGDHKGRDAADGEGGETAQAEKKAGGFVRVLRALGRDLTRNPIVIAVAAGIVWRIAGLSLPGPLDKTLALVAQAGVPSALIALGLNLVRFEIKGQMATLWSIVAVKLLLMPAVAWLLAVKVFHLPPAAAGVVVVFACVPTGANAFLFAVQHNRAVNSASGAVALGTLLAAVTVSVALSVMGTGR